MNKRFLAAAILACLYSSAAFAAMTPRYNAALVPVQQPAPEPEQPAPAANENNAQQQQTDSQQADPDSIVAYHAEPPKAAAQNNAAPPAPVNPTVTTPGRTLGR